MSHKIWLSLMCLLLVHTDPTYHSLALPPSSSFLPFGLRSAANALDYYTHTTPPDEFEILDTTIPPEDTTPLTPELEMTISPPEDTTPLAPELEITLSPPEATPLASELEVTWPPPDVTVPLTTPLGHVPVNFQSFESRVKNFINNVNLNQLSTISDTTGFFEEIDDYLSRLPAKNFTKIVTSKSRGSCYCGGAIVTPCPLQCIYSCYVKLEVNVFSGSIREEWVHLDDCKATTWVYFSAKECRCSEQSDIDCKFTMDSCFNVTTEHVQEPHCSDFHIDKTAIVQSFDLKLNLLIESLKVFFREVEFRLMSLKRLALSIENRANILEPNCQIRTGPNCFSDWQFLSAEKQTYDQIKSNITSELIRSQNLIDKVSIDVEELKKLYFSHINQSIKDYSCCLQNLNLTVGIYDCHGVKTVGE